MKLKAVFCAMLLAALLCGCASTPAVIQTQMTAAADETTTAVQEKNAFSDPAIKTETFSENTAVLPAEQKNTTGKDTAVSETEVPGGELPQAKGSAEDKADTESAAETTAAPVLPAASVTETTAAPAETEAAAAQTEAPSAVPAFDVGTYVTYAKDYGSSIGLTLDPGTTGCWDTPTEANARCAYLKRDLSDLLDWYRGNGVKFFWVWSEDLGNGEYDIYVGYSY